MATRIASTWHHHQHTQAINATNYALALSPRRLAEMAMAKAMPGNNHHP